MRFEPTPPKRLDFSKKFVLVTDANNQGVGAILANREQARAQLKPIAFYHHALTQAERRYGTTEKNYLQWFLLLRNSECI